MALITCLECGNQVSSRADSCPRCGCPIDNANEEPSILVSRPKLSDDLSIGGQVVNWQGDASLRCDFSPQLYTKKYIPEHKGGMLLLHKRGIRVIGVVYIPIINIHFSQLISIECVPQSKLLESDKSVIKRAAVGTLIFGPLGGIVGGMSGIGNKKTYLSLIILTYWDIKSDSLHKLLLSTKDETAAKRFSESAMKESAAGLSNTQQHKSVPTKNNPPLPQKNNARDKKSISKKMDIPTDESSNLSRKSCPKCGYNRKIQDDEYFPKTECPSCGLIYSKYTQKVANKKDTEKESHRTE